MARIYQESCHSRKKHCCDNNSVSIFLFVYHLAYRSMHNTTTTDLRCDLFSHDVTRYELLMHNDTWWIFFLIGDLKIIIYRNPLPGQPVSVCVQAIVQYRCRNKIYLKRVNCKLILCNRCIQVDKKMGALKCLNNCSFSRSCISSSIEL